MQKDELRQLYLVRRRELSDRDLKNAQLTERLKALLKTLRFRHLVLYRSFRLEPDLQDIARAYFHVPTYYPKLKGDRLLFYPAAPDGPFVKNRLGIEEPLPEGDADFSPGPDTVLVIPGLAFDLNGFRLGYGGGYYDRLLAHCQPQTIGICFDEFLLPTLPHDGHDIAMRMICSEQRSIPVPESCS